MLRRWKVKRRENGHVTEVASIIKGRMIMLERWSV